MDEAQGSRPNITLGFGKALGGSECSWRAEAEDNPFLWSSNKAETEREGMTEREGNGREGKPSEKYYKDLLAMQKDSPVESAAKSKLLALIRFDRTGGRLTDCTSEGSVLSKDTVASPWYEGLASRYKVALGTKLAEMPEARVIDIGQSVGRQPFAKDSNIPAALPGSKLWVVDGRVRPQRCLFGY